MGTDLQSKLEKLKSDYVSVTGIPFSHFFCPVVFDDQDVTLCKAHIINQFFPGSSRAWTVQRKDVDNFLWVNV
jgi:hypothetical protein